MAEAESGRIAPAGTPARNDKESTRARSGRSPSRRAAGEREAMTSDKLRVAGASPCVRQLKWLIVIGIVLIAALLIGKVVA